MLAAVSGHNRPCCAPILEVAHHTVSRREAARPLPFVRHQYFPLHDAPVENSSKFARLYAYMQEV
jgi:hypothetical protein